MAIEVGKEAEYVGHRLNDIVFFCECTAPVDENDWADYAKAVLNLIKRSAREAQTAMVVLQPPR